MVLYLQNEITQTLFQWRCQGERAYRGSISCIGYSFFCHDTGTSSARSAKKRPSSRAQYKAAPFLSIQGYPIEAFENGLNRESMLSPVDPRLKSSGMTKQVRFPRIVVGGNPHLVPTCDSRGNLGRGIITKSLIQPQPDHPEFISGFNKNKNC